MKIVCTICSDLLEPSSDVYHTPCGHIFHFQCLTKWIDRSKTCPQCREKTTARSIQRIYFNCPNDDYSYIGSSENLTETSAKLQIEVDSLNFKLTLANKQIKDLNEDKHKLESVIVPLQQEIRRNEETMKNKDNAIFALKEQVQYCKVLRADMEKKDKKIEVLNTKLEKLRSVQDILDASTHEVDHMIDTYSDIPKLQTFVSVLKRELENSIAQRRRLREEASAKNRAELLQTRSKLRQLEETLKNQKEGKAILQAKLLEMQIEANNCKCNKITAVEKKYNSTEVSTTTETECTSNSYNNKTVKIEENNDRITADNAENTPQNIKSQGFFSMTNRRGIKRTGNSVTVPSILAKKPMNFMNFNEMNQLKKKTVNSDMTFDGFGGHAKYDKFPNLTQSVHTKKPRDKTKT